LLDAIFGGQKLTKSESNSRFRGDSDLRLKRELPLHLSSGIGEHNGRNTYPMREDSMKVRSTHPTRSGLAAVLAALVLAPIMTTAGVSPVHAAKSDGCSGGTYSLVNKSTNAVVASGNTTRTIAAASFGTGRFAVRGVYNEFDVGLADFAVFNYAFTGAPNPLDMTGGVRTPVFASKLPDHRGLTLTSAINVEMSDGDLVITRTGPGLTMKIQSKDCAAGGIFQMEVERGDGTRTRISHTLVQDIGALTPFFFDNPNFRARVGQFLGDGCTSITTGPPSQFCVQVTTRVNIANGFSKNFVLRDSSQVATRINQADCNTATPVTPSVRHCGSVSVWDVASGGRLGFVTGEDAVEVANPPTVCTKNCQAQNRVRGRLAVLDFPFPVPAGSRLTPAVSALPLPALTAP
jgi:hypothetical protein